MPSVIQLENVTYGYDRNSVVWRVSGSFAQGSMTAVVGPNGGGKSTLLKGIMGWLRAWNGRVVWQGLSLADVGYLPQRVEIDRSFPMTVLDAVLLGFWRQCGGWRSMTAAMKARARQALVEVGLPECENRLIGGLSSGQFQRVLFARLMVQDARVLLLDEPFSAIDAGTAEHLLCLARQWHVEGRTIIAVLHDFDQVRRFFPETLLLAREIIGWGATSEILIPPFLSQARVAADVWDQRSKAA
ncbi:zinc/manganese transport system ATP-binding protein [Azospirillaceae bacterium]